MMRRVTPSNARAAGLRWMVVLSAVAVLGACDTPRTPPGRTLALHECRLAHVALAAQCGALEVPENRTQPQGRRINIAVAVLAANTLSPAPDPLFILAGGPGQAASALGPFAARLTAVRRNRDIVLVDQRGTGRSSPLDCAAFKDVASAEAALELDPVPRATQCVAELKAHGVDASQYTTAAWIADLDAVRGALGYERVNLWGGSYGTRAALEYVRHFPQHVRTMTLDGVAPPWLKVSLDVWRTREAALAAVFDACAASPTCRKNHGSLATELNAVDEQLGGGGRDLTVTDPRTGNPRALHITFEHVIAAMQAPVYLPEFASLVPEALHQAGRGDLGPLYATALAMTSGLAEQLNSALYYSVTCAEDTPRITVQDREAKLAGLRSRPLAERGLAVCDVWPKGGRAADSDAPVTSDVPTLLLSGGLDPVTPPAYAADVAKTLRNSRHIVATGYGHNVSPHGCAPRLIASFIEDAGFIHLPASCVAHLEQSARPPLWPDRLGPQP